MKDSINKINIKFFFWNKIEGKNVKTILSSIFKDSRMWEVFSIISFQLTFEQQLRQTKAPKQQKIASILILVNFWWMQKQTIKMNQNESEFVQLLIIAILNHSQKNLLEWITSVGKLIKKVPFESTKKV